MSAFALNELEVKVAHLRSQQSHSVEFGEALNELAEAYLGLDAAKSLRLSHEAYHKAVALDSAALQAASLWKIGWLSVVYGQNIQSLSYLTKAQQLARHISDPALEARIAYGMGVAHGILGNYAEALQNRLRALELARQLGLRGLEADCLDAIGSEYAEIGDHDQALSRYSTALDIYRGLNSPREPYVLAHIAENCMGLQDFPQALHYAQLALNVSQRLSSSWRRSLPRPPENVQPAIYEPILLRVLGRVHLGLENGKRALQYFEQALKGYEGEAATVNSHVPCAHEYLMLRLEIGKAHVLLQDPGQAERIWGMTLVQAQQNAVRPVEMHLHDLLYQFHRQADRPQVALLHHESWLMLNQSIFTAETDRRIKLLKVTHETREAQHEARVLRLKATELEQIVQTRTHALEHAQIEMLERLAAAVEARDAPTGSHIKRVGTLSVALARKMGLEEELVEMIRLAAPLHDIGKISIPDHILFKREGLSPQESQIMRDHTLIGARMLSQGTSRLIRMAEMIALSHHEYWNGAGYPHQLAGEQIPLPGRIVAVADAFDAMISKRPYKLAYTLPRALEEILRCAGTQFDPKVVAALVEWVESRNSAGLAL